MPSVEELLSQDSKDEYINISPINDIITIDPETRTINLPASETLFGTKQEMNVERKYFKCPKIVGDNIDLSKHQIYITYVTAKDNVGTFLPEEEPGLYYCEDMAVDGDYITFSWLLSGNVLNNHGFIAFAVSAKHMDGEVLKTRWKTKPAVGTVLLTVPDGEAIVERYPDIITQLLDRMNEVEAIATEEAMQGYVNDYLGRNPVQLDPTLTDSTKAAPADLVGELKGDLDDVKREFNEAITHTQVVDLLDGVSPIIGYTYSRTATTENNYSIDANGAIFPLVSIVKGKTYSYVAIRPYFSSVLYTNGTRLDFDAINNGSNDGKFVAEDNGTLFLSVRKTDVDNVKFYLGDADRESGYFINELKIYDSDIEKDNIIHVGKTREIKGFIEAINKSKDGDTIIFDEQDYDIVAELGQSWLDTYTYDKRGYGFYLGGGKKLIFPYGATVKFNYDGSNSEVHQYFSPINAGAGDFEIIGLHLFAKNCRYAIHDERATNELLYHHIFKDCHIELDNSNNQDWNSKQCIGGGLGVNGKINIENCVFNSVDGIYDVSYHNSASDHAKSFIAITNCWFENSCRFSWYGQSQRTTMILFNGNSIKTDITVSEEGTGSGAPYENIIVKKWGNEIR